MRCACVYDNRVFVMSDFYDEATDKVLIKNQWRYLQVLYGFSNFIDPSKSLSYETAVPLKVKRGKRLNLRT